MRLVLRYLLLERFRALFNGQAYLHRKSNLGDIVAAHLYEDLYQLGSSQKYIDRVDSARSVLNTQNVRRGIRARRGDGTFGEIVPNVSAKEFKHFTVRRGATATIEIGVEVKIMMKAMMKQIDRVENDLRKQTEHFRSRNGNPICIGIVGINRAPHCTTYEGDRAYTTDGKRYRHPADEASRAEDALVQRVALEFDEFLILRFEATNEAPYRFSWTNKNDTHLDYGAALVRISKRYQDRV